MKECALCASVRKPELRRTATSGCKTPESTGDSKSTGRTAKPNADPPQPSLRPAPLRRAMPKTKPTKEARGNSA
eukprot:13451058-Alexandrium_andersonii.AAC.1